MSRIEAAAEAIEELWAYRQGDHVPHAVYVPDAEAALAAADAHDAAHGIHRVNLDEVVREARAKALEDAAAVLARLPYVAPFDQGRETYEHMLAVRRGNTDGWLLARAAEERKP